MRFLLITPVARRQRVRQSACDRRRFHAHLQIEVTILVDVLLRRQANLQQNEF